MVSTSFGRKPERLEQIENDAGIHGARPRPHAETVERGEAERAVDALAFLERAQAGAIAEMSDDYTAVRDLVRVARQNRSDVFVRQPMKAITLYTGAPDLRAAAAPVRRPRAGRDETPCRSRRPAGRPEGVPRPHRSPRDCAADAAARAAPAGADGREPRWSRPWAWRSARRHARRDDRRRARWGAGSGRATSSRAHRAQREGRPPPAPAPGRQSLLRSHPSPRIAARCRCLRSGRAHPGATLHRVDLW